MVKDVSWKSYLLDTTHNVGYELSRQHGAYLIELIRRFLAFVDASTACSEQWLASWHAVHCRAEIEVD